MSTLAAFKAMASDSQELCMVAGRNQFSAYGWGELTPADRRRVAADIHAIELDEISVDVDEDVDDAKAPTQAATLLAARIGRSNLKAYAAMLAAGDRGNR